MPDVRLIRDVRNHVLAQYYRIKNPENMRA